MKAVKKYTKGGKPMAQEGLKVGENYDPQTKRKLMTYDSAETGVTSRNPYQDAGKKETSSDLLKKHTYKRMVEALDKTGKKYPTTRISEDKLMELARKEGVYQGARKLAVQDMQKEATKNKMK